MIFLAGCSNFQEKGEVTKISPETLIEVMEKEDIILFDVHTPEQEHIPGTDYVIAYTELEKIKSAIPNKNSKVAFYCRSGSMSEIVTKQLAEEGYTNVYDVVGGKKAWDLK